MPLFLIFKPFCSTCRPTIRGAYRKAYLPVIMVFTVFPVTLVLAVRQYEGCGEFHASGVVTFPLLGTAAPLNEKLAFDPDRRKRRKIYQRVCQVFGSWNVFIGGSSSFDLTQGECNKYFALKSFCENAGYSLDEAVYFGDDFGEGGNDSHVKNGGVDCIEVVDYRDFSKLANFLF